MVLTKHRPRHDEAALLDATVHPAPAAHLSGSDRDRAPMFDDVDALEMPHDWQPGRTADKLNHNVVRDEVAKLRAETASPTALREAFDRPAGTWLPATVGMRAVPLTAVPVDDIDTVLADIAAVAAAHPDALRHPDVLIALGIALCDAITAQSDAEQQAEVAV